MRMINKPGKFFLATLLLFPLPLLAQDGGEPQLTEEVPTEEVKKTFEELTFEGWGIFEKLLELFVPMGIEMLKMFQIVS